jgi:glutamyl-tRNA synthetase
VTRPAERCHNPYRGRIAPSPTGYLHLGHARTFWTAQQRAARQQGTLILRNEDIDRARCKPEFVSAMSDDLKWFGFHWQEGTEYGGPQSPYEQSKRYPLYREALDKLRTTGFAYPCTCSRKDIQSAASAPQGADDELIYPGTCRPSQNSPPLTHTHLVSWRFRVPDGRRIEFMDSGMGPQRFVAGKDFGDFVLWRNDDVPAYQLAVVVDDASMGITEVVRGEDLLVSTARQLLLFEALGLQPPTYHHCPLMTDENGVRLAKRHAALSLRALRERGISPEELRADW